MAELLDIDTGNAADMVNKTFSWSFTRVKLTASSSSIAMSGGPNTYIYLDIPAGPRA